MNQQMSSPHQLLAQQSDEQVAVLARERNPEHFGDLVLRYQDRLQRFVRSIVWDEESARDVAQVAFEKAFVALNAYDARKPFRPWLFGIARNEAFSHLRRTRARPSVPFSTLTADRQNEDGDAPQLDIADQRPGPDEQLVAQDSAGRLRAALVRLDPRYRAVLTLYYLEDMPYEEAARVLRLPLNTVRTHLRRGKRALAALLESEQRNFQARSRVPSVPETAP
jgi:RNA polymerase sigma-70 factor (ECF subfamily)